MEDKPPYDATLIRKSLRVGHIYLTFSGDEDLPFCFAKIVSMDGNQLWLKLWYDKFTEQPLDFDSKAMPGGFRIIPASIEMFLGWGPPKFPIYVTEESVTEEELANRSPF